MFVLLNEFSCGFLGIELVGILTSSCLYLIFYLGG